jgi:hypothetical protein
MAGVLTPSFFKDSCYESAHNLKGGKSVFILFSTDPWLFVRGEAEPAITAVVNGFSLFSQEH